MCAYFALTAAFVERKTVMATLMDNSNRISTEDFVAVAFTSTECAYIRNYTVILIKILHVKS